MENEPWDLMMVYYEAIDQAGHEFMPFHPPQLPGVRPQDYHHWHLAIEGFYRFHDQMLARLVELAGENTVVLLCSDHGFVSGAQRPGPVANDRHTQAQWHRPMGILALHGPGILAGERLYGASLLDIAPTVLHLLQLPCGQDMDGKVLAQAFSTEVQMQTIPSWDSQEPALASFMPQAAADEAAEAAVLQQFAALGYVESPAAGAGVEEAERELLFNEAVANNAAGRRAQAAEMLRGLCQRDPEQPRYQMALIQALLPLGLTSEARAALQSLPHEWRLSADTVLLECQLLLKENHRALALQLLRDALATHNANPFFLCQYGMILLRDRRWAEGETHFRSAIALDPENAFAWHGLATALLEQEELEQAVDAALHALSVRHFFPEAHFVMARALLRLGDAGSAKRALEIALSQNPHHAASHSVLSRLHQRLGNKAQSEHHRNAWLALRAASAS
jgi:tetratricopeptide (TPR) repeat protein